MREQLFILKKKSKNVAIKLILRYRADMILIIYDCAVGEKSVSALK